MPPTKKDEAEKPAARGEDVPCNVCLYHPDAPQGRVFKSTHALEDAIAEGGWVDSPAELETKSEE